MAFPPLATFMAESIAPQSLTAWAVITASPLDNIAGMLSEVPEPGPVTRPPEAYFGVSAESVICVACAMAATTVAILDAIVIGIMNHGALADEATALAMASACAKTT